MMKLDIVVVTFNRLEKLRKALSCYENQTLGFRNLIVVNNYSTDGTSAFLDIWKQSASSKFHKFVINTTENLGGSGGFYYGQKYAIGLSPDWIFLADDDAYPDSRMIEYFNLFIQSNPLKSIVAVCSSVYNTDGTICFPHRSSVKITYGLKFELVHSLQRDYDNSFFDLDVFTYVGPFINCNALKKVGLANKDFFIYADDADHSLRLRTVGRIVCVPSLKIVHDSGEFSEKSSDLIVSWRDYYRIRNYLYMLTVHYRKCVPYKLLLCLRECLQATGIQAKKMYVVAMINALTRRLGKHHIYKPGWSIKTKQTN